MPRPCVLILVLVDVGLGRPFPSTTGKLYVLILVLVDVGLGHTVVFITVDIDHRS